MAGNVATLHAAPLPTNRWDGWRRRGGRKCAACLERGSNNGGTATADEHQLAIGGLPLSEDRLSLRDAAGRMIGS
jgi:hypothetical protein